MTGTLASERMIVNIPSENIRCYLIYRSIRRYITDIHRSIFINEALSLILLTMRLLPYKDHASLGAGVVALKSSDLSPK